VVCRVKNQTTLAAHAIVQPSGASVGVAGIKNEFDWMTTYGIYLVFHTGLIVNRDTELPHDLSGLDSDVTIDDQLHADAEQ
jgi:hypothetical protein